MRTAVKKRILAVCVTALVVWPAIHFALVKTLNIHPWRFAGWAMYSVYHPRSVRVELWRCDDDRPPLCREQIQFSELSRPLQLKLTRFSRERSVWGALRSVDGIANDLEPLMQDSPILRITLGDTTLDPGTNTLRRTQQRFDFQRSKQAGAGLRRLG